MMKSSKHALCLVLCLSVVGQVEAAGGAKSRRGGKQNPVKQLVQRFDRDGDQALNAAELAHALVAGRGLIAPPAKGQLRTHGRTARRPATRGGMRAPRRGRGARPVVPLVVGMPDPFAQAGAIVGSILGQYFALNRALVGPPSAAQVAHVLIQRFDRDGSGTLNEAELTVAVGFLRRLIAAEEARARSLAPIVVNRRRGRAGHRFGLRRGLRRRHLRHGADSKESKQGGPANANGNT